MNIGTLGKIKVAFVCDRCTDESANDDHWQEVVVDGRTHLFCASCIAAFHLWMEAGLPKDQVP